MAVSKRTRFEVLRRDNHACRYCGATAPDVKMHVDHVTPVSLGGTDAPDNLVAACIDCNFGKSSSSPDATLVADVNADAVRWARAMKRAAEIQVAEGNAQAEWEERIDAWFSKHCWERWSYGDIEDPFKLPLEWARSFRRLMEQGISADMLRYWIDETIERGRVHPENIFRYVCGIAWKKIREQQDIAKQLIEEEDAAS